MKTANIARAMLLAATLTACSAPEVRNTYEGAERPNSEVAILFTPQPRSFRDAYPRALFSAVDGRTFGSATLGYPAVARVAPGEVLVKVNCVPPGTHPRWDSFLLFRTQLKAGHYYELACNRVTASAIDRGTSYEAVRHLLPEALHAELGR